MSPFCISTFVTLQPFLHVILCFSRGPLVELHLTVDLGDRVEVIIDARNTHHGEAMLDHLVWLPDVELRQPDEA